jgi:hypothetical protein
MAGLMARPKSLIRIQDWTDVHVAMAKLHRHVVDCVACCSIWQLLPSNLSLEAISKLPEHSSGWCVPGREIYLKDFAKAAQLAIDEAL